MRLLVLGANGFIGNHLAGNFSKQGYEVIRADITSGDDPRCLVFDAVNPDFAEVFHAASADVCVNCTGAASVPESFQQPLRDYTLNTLRIAQMLDALSAVSPATKFVHLSSAAVYGNPSESPITEAAAIKPLSPYGWHKHYAEELCREYTQFKGIASLSVRVFSAFGPGLRKQLFWDIYQKAKASDRVELFGTGEEARDFIYVEDIATCIDVLIRHGKFDGRAVNAANGRAVTVREAVSILFDALGWERELVFSGTERVGDPSFWQADVSYLRELGMKPAFTFEEGVKLLAAWLLSQDS